MDVYRTSLAGDAEPDWGAPQLQAGHPVRSGVAKPQHLTAVFVKPDGNGLFCPAFVQSPSFWGELKLGDSI